MSTATVLSNEAFEKLLDVLEQEAKEDRDLRERLMRRPLWAKKPKLMCVKMEREDVVRELEKLAELSKADPESAHAQADEWLCDFLSSRGYGDIVNAYENIEKWYA